MTRGNKYFKALDIQEEIEGKSEDIDLARKIFDIINTSMELNTLFNIKHYRYGKNSYECHRFYYPNELAKKLINIK
jgi:hypothetical protein